MDRLRVEQFFNFVKSGGLRGGDIIFVATHSYTGIISATIKAAQIARSTFHEQYENGLIPYVQFTHVAIVVQTKNPGGIINTFFVESDPPRTRQVSLSEFFNKRIKKEFSLFRTNLPQFGSLISYYGHHYAKYAIPYFNLKDCILCLKPRAKHKTPGELPNSTNCSSFVAFIYNTASYYGNLNHHTMPINCTHIAPYLLYHFFKDKERNEHTWKEIIQAIQY